MDESGVNYFLFKNYLYFFYNLVLDVVIVIVFVFKVCFIFFFVWMKLLVKMGIFVFFLIFLMSDGMMLGSILIKLGLCLLINFMFFFIVFVLSRNRC